MAPTPGKEHIAETLLARAHSPDTTSTIFKERIKQKPLLLRPSSPDRRKSSTDARQKRRQAREAKLAAERKKSRKPKPLSAKRKRALCLYEIPTEQRKYSIYVPLHAMWCEYMRDILGFSSSDGDGARGGRAQYMTGTSAGPVLVSADYHGSLAEVVRSRCASRVGLKGIVVKDTKFTFDIITEKDELKSEFKLEYVHLLAYN